MVPELSIDTELLEEIREQMQERFGPVIACYINDAENFIADLSQAIEDKDAKAAYFSSHALKSASLQLGINRLSGIAQLIEHDARAEAEEKIPCNWSKQQEHLEMALEEFLSVRRALPEADEDSDPSE